MMMSEKIYIGYYVDDLEEFDFEPLVMGEMNDRQLIEALKFYAVDYSDNNHQIDEDSDLNFEIFVKFRDILYKFKMKTEYDPTYHVDKFEKI